MFTLPESRAAGKSSSKSQKTAAVTVAFPLPVTPSGLDHETARQNAAVIEFMLAGCPANVAPAWRQAHKELRRACPETRPARQPRKATKAPQTRPASARTRARRAGRSKRSPQRTRAARPPGRASADDGDGPPPAPAEEAPKPVHRIVGGWAMSEEHYDRVRHGGDSWLTRD